MLFLGAAVLALLISIGLSLRAAGRIPADARVPIHMGWRKWNGFVSRKTALWQWPLAVGVLAAVFAGSGLSVPGGTPLPLLVLFGVAVVGALLLQRAAFRWAERGGAPEAEASGLPKWVAALVTGLILVPAIALAAMFLWPRGGPPTEVVLHDDHMVVHLRGPYKAFALRSKLVVPFDRLIAIRTDPTARNLPRGARVGTSAPGVIAGRFTSRECRAFWAIDDGFHAVVIDLQGHAFDRLVVEVASPDAIVATIEEKNPAIGSDQRSPCDH